MGFKTSVSRGTAPLSAEEGSIFKLLSQLTRTGGGDCGEEELDSLFLQFLSIRINDLPYEALEIYCQSFVIENLLNVNLRHGNLYGYWNRYSNLLEQILDNEIPAAVHKSTVVDPPNSTKEDHNNELDSCAEGDLPINPDSTDHAKDVGDGIQTTSSKSHRKSSVSLAAIKDIFSRKSRGSRSNSGSIELNNLTRANTGEKQLSIYKEYKYGKIFLADCLSIFVVSRILCKGLIGKINTTEFLFHMDYIAYYLSNGVLAFFKLENDQRDECAPRPVSTPLPTGKAEDSVKETVENADEERSDNEVGFSDKNILTSGSSSDSQEEGDSCTEENRIYYRRMTLNICTEDKALTIKVARGATSSQIVDDVIETAKKVWSIGTMESLKCGFCLVDAKMSIFSLMNIARLLESVTADVEFAIIPFCTSTYGTQKDTSPLQKLFNATYSYITADFQPISDSHEAFLMASRSMAADVLVMLLSCIVMKPYLFTKQEDAEKTFPLAFRWINEVSPTTKSVAPFYYIHMDAVRSQLLMDPLSEMEQHNLESVMAYSMNYSNPIKYGLLDSLHSRIGPEGLDKTAYCLIRLLRLNTSTKYKVHVNNLRNHVTTLLLLLLEKGRGNEVSNSMPYRDNPRDTSGDHNYKEGASVSSIANDTETTDVGVNEGGEFTGKSDKGSGGSYIEFHLSPEVIVGIANALASVSPSVIYSQESLLLLVDAMSETALFSNIFYSALTNFTKEVLSSLNKKYAVGKCKEENNIPKSPTVRTLIRITSHYFRHCKNTDVEDTSLNIAKILHVLLEVLQWNFECQKDELLINSALLLADQLFEMPLVINRAASQSIINFMCSWMSTANIYMDKIPVGKYEVPSIASIKCMMLLKMVFVASKAIKVALSPATLDMNLDLVQAILDHCSLDTLEGLLFSLKDNSFDDTSALLGLDEIRGGVIKMLDFVSLILRTFMGFKMQSMHLFTENKEGFSATAVMAAVSELIREINEEDADKKSALALAIGRDLIKPFSLKENKAMLRFYHMSQLWISAYSNQQRLKLWHYYPPKR
ncbi:hypothetical protein BgAZ_404610 [Babesia gibsoni]|uniref:Uncharacterized protein n=1 Tax=Babesia gibsoni TaxID=33632 RepID=A0AAD8LNQ3_BABGI|nr:hypothetical protein BgAZ_404610 [Babesia gibsoni]